MRAMPSEPEAAGADGGSPAERARCLDCGYALRRLQTRCCPECGRAFDLSDPATYTTRQRHLWLERAMRRPIGIPTFAAVAVLCAATWWLACWPSMYYFVFPMVWTLGALWVGAWSILTARRVVRDIVVLPAHAPRTSSRYRYRLIAGLVGATTLAVLFHVPLRVQFAFARPELDRWVQEILSGNEANPGAARRAGLHSMARSPWYGDADRGVYFLRFAGRNSGGYAYAAQPVDLGQHYNTGTHGRLGGGWYWWIDD